MYISIRTGLTERTQAEHDRTLRFLCDRLGTDCLIQKITPVDARRFLSCYGGRKVQGQRSATPTVNKTLRECRRIFREAVDCQLIRSNPFEGMRQERVGDSPWHHVTPEEFHRPIGAASSARWKGIIALAYCCGLRLGEILNLTWTKIDWQNHRLKVVSTKEWSTKTRQSRIAPIRPELHELLLAAAGDAMREAREFVIGPDAIDVRNLWRDFGVLCKRAGLTRWAGPLHSLRKSCITDWA